MPRRERFDDTVSDFSDRADLRAPGQNSYKISIAGERNSLPNSYRSYFPVSPRANVNLFDPYGQSRDAAASPQRDFDIDAGSANEQLSDIVPSGSEEADRVSVRPRAVDRRRYSPVGSLLWPSTLVGAPARIKYSKFQAATDFCVDRQTRRQVLFAKRKAGRGSHKRKRRGPFSSMRCR